MNAVQNLGSVNLTMTSREIADLVEQRHDNVKRTIETLGSRGVITLPQIEEVSNDGPGPRVVGVYKLGKRDSLVVVAQLCPEFTARIVDRWQELEAMVEQPRIPQTMPEALRLAAEAIEQRDKLALENKVQAEELAEAKPKAQGFDLIAAGEKSVTIRETAKLLGIKETRLTAWLHENGWTYRLNGRWVAKSEHIQGGRLVYKEAKYTDEKTGHEVYAPYCHITPKGLAKLARVFGSPMDMAA
jgi:phage antirepressor YoqD-like protein